MRVGVTDPQPENILLKVVVCLNGTDNPVCDGPPKYHVKVRNILKYLVNVNAVHAEQYKRPNTGMTLHCSVTSWGSVSRSLTLVISNHRCLLQAVVISYQYIDPLYFFSVFFSPFCECILAYPFFIIVIAMIVLLCIKCGAAFIFSV